LQLAEGLELMHRNGFAHRDLKPQVRTGRDESPFPRDWTNVSTRISWSSVRARPGGSR
jgi:hypothetical protein